MDLVTLTQLIVLILENLKVKPRKHDLERISMAIAAYLLGVPITKLGIPPSTIYYYTRKLGVRKRREIRPNCPSCKSDKVIKNGSSRGTTCFASNRPKGIENLRVSIMCPYIFFVVIIPCFLCIVLSVSAPRVFGYNLLLGV